MVTDREVFASDEVKLAPAAEGIQVRSLVGSPRVAANRNALELRGSKYLVTWFFIVALHCLCAVYLTLLAKVWWAITHPYLEYFAKLVAGERHIYFKQAGVAFGLIAALHWWQLVCIAWASIRAKELVLPDGSSTAGHVHATITKTLSTRRLGSTRFSSAMLSAQLRTLALPSRFAFRAWRFLFSRHGVFGIESDFFPIVFTIRELIEIVSQSFQARRSSELLSQQWLNNLFVTLVVVNCWSTPILQHFLRHHQGTERVICLLLDVLLNIGSCMLIPTIVFLPYYTSFIPEIYLWPIENLYDGLWFSRFTMENQLLFSLSTADIFSKIIPHLGIYSSLSSLVTLIHRKGSRRKSRVLAINMDLQADGSTAGDTPRGSPTGKARATQIRSLVAHIFFFLWGLGLLVLHLRAVTRNSEVVTGCRQVTGSWFATDYPCSVYTYNCYREGTVSPDEDSWNRLDKESLVYFAISHCPELKVPNALQNFPSVIGLQIHNSTIVEWTKENALSPTKHAKLIALIITRTNMTELPEGILGPLPTTLMDIELSHTNLTSLPSDLSDRWNHSMATVYFEHSLLTEFPETLLKMEAIEFSLHSNQIEKVPAIPANYYFLSFTMGSNPLKELPETIGEGTMFSYLSLENTELETLPAWATSTSTIEAYAFMYGTPYCAANTPDAAATRVVCVERDSRIEGKVPMYVMDSLYPL